jgi:hypothetical protein
MRSLKALLPRLAEALGMTPAALYERQRSLVLGGLLECAPGKGPGSGVRGTPEALATLLVSVLSSQQWADSASVTKVMAEAFALPLDGLPSGAGTCPLTGAGTFRDAVTRVLADPSLLERVDSISVHSIGQAWISYDGVNLPPPDFVRSQNSIFMAPNAKSGPRRIDVRIMSDTIGAIAALVQVS